MYIPAFPVVMYMACVTFIYILFSLALCALLHLRRNLTWQKLGSKEFITSVSSLEWNVSFSFPFPFSFKLDGRNSPSRFSSSAILLLKICLETRFLHMKMCVLISPFCVSLFLSQVWRVIWGHQMSVLEERLTWLRVSWPLEKLSSGMRTFLLATCYQEHLVHHHQGFFCLF